jgi:hypothetical protein
MARATAAVAKIQARALRARADEIEEGRRHLSPELSRVLAAEIEGSDADDLSPQDWAKAWAPRSIGVWQAPRPAR